MCICACFCVQITQLFFIQKYEDGSEKNRLMVFDLCRRRLDDKVS